MIAAVSCAAVLGLPDPSLEDGTSTDAREGDSRADDDAGDGGALDDASGDSDASTDALDAEPKWLDIKRINVSTAQDDGFPSLTDDERTIMWTSGRAAEFRILDSGSTVYWTTRNDAAAPFDASVKTFNGGHGTGCMGPTGTEAFIGIGADGSGNIYWSERQSGQFGTYIATNLDPGHTVHACRTLMADASVMYFSGEDFPPTPPNGLVYRVVRTGQYSWTTPVLVPLGGYDVAPVVRSDELEIFFARWEGTSFAIYTATRSNALAAFASVTKLAELDSVGNEFPGWLSRDGCRLYFSATRGDAGMDLWVTKRRGCP